MKIDTKELDRAEKLIEAGDYASAGEIADKELQNFPSLENFASLSRAALLKGNSIMLPLVDKLLDEAVEEKPGVELFRMAWEMFQMSIRLDPQNKEATYNIDYLKHLMVKPKKKRSTQVSDKAAHFLHIYSSW